MKKSIFTAIAIMAFVGTSLGNTIVDKGVQEELQMEDGDYWSCAKEADDMYNEIISLTGEPSEALMEADAAFDDCIGLPCRPPFLC